MGLVYKARHQRLPKSFAIKVLFGDMASDNRMRLRFAQEAAAACQLSHPNVVTVQDFGKSDHGLLYLVMDYVEGETLSQLIAREAPLDQRRVIALGRALAEGLSHAHAQGIVHRDFKPDNIVLEPRDDGQTVPRILDFGLAISAKDDLFDGRLTQHGYVVGTPAYLSPEQARDQPVDHRADLFALGVVLYEMLAGVAPFEGSAMEVAHRNMLEPVPPLKVRNRAVEVAPELEAVVRRLVEKAPEDRYATAEELIEALDRVEAILDRGPDEISHAESPILVLGEVPVAQAFVPDDDELRPRRGRRVAAVALVLAVAAGLVHLLTGNPTATIAAVMSSGSTEVQVAMPDLPARAVEAAPMTQPEAEPVPAEAAPPPAEAAPPPRAAPQRSRARRTAVAKRPLAPATTHRPNRRAAVTPRLAPAPPVPVASTPTPALPRQALPDASVNRLIEEYRQLGQAIGRLHGEGDPALTEKLRERYFRLPYADALRIPSVRRDTLAQLGALRRDLAAATRRQ
jgi:tRNA A-37 threonylcarbamoyl transferase component Bud32